MPKTMLVNVTHVEESRVAVLNDGVLEAYEIETLNRAQIKGNIYNAVVENVSRQRPTVCERSWYPAANRPLLMSTRNCRAASKIWTRRSTPNSQAASGMSQTERGRTSGKPLATTKTGHAAVQILEGDWI